MWHGPSRRILEAARDGQITLLTSLELLAELADVLGRDKFAERLRAAQVTANDLVLGYAALAQVTAAGPIPPTILDDPDDDAVLACALAAGADVIVSGDDHLLRLGAYQRIVIMSPAALIVRLEVGPAPPA